MIEMYPVVGSTTVMSAGYDEVSQTLRIKFYSAAIHEYRQVSAAWFEKFCHVASKGKFLAGILRDKVTYEQRRVTHRRGRKKNELACLDCGCPREESASYSCQRWADGTPADETFYTVPK